MVDAFATADDLAARLNREFTTEEETWITTLLEDASTYLRDDVLGMQVFPESTSTYLAWPDGGRIDLPQNPVISVDAVTQEGEALVEDDDWHRRDSTVYVRRDVPTTVTFTYGYTLAPESLKRWTCVLVSQVLLPLEQNLGLTAGGLSSVQVDDFKAAWADAGAESGITLSDRNIHLIREQFGANQGWVVSSR